jgi:phage shock protein PspC (stress-responsive transcriptional regulator)
VTLIGGAGILGYIIAWIIIPKKNDGQGQEKSSKGCLYAILIVIFASIAVGVITPFIRFFVSVATSGVSMIPGGNYSYNIYNVSPNLFQWAFMLIAVLVFIAVIAAIIHLIKKAGDRDDR